MPRSPSHTARPHARSPDPSAVRARRPRADAACTHAPRARARQAANEGGWRALHFACDGGHTEVARLLSEKGARLDAATKGGRTLADLNAEMADALEAEASERADEEADQAAEDAGAE